MSNNFLTEFLDFALYYAKQSFAVFPLKPQSKEPATAHGFKDATTDPNQIRTWWTENPSYNIGMATGDVSGIVVVDKDGNIGAQSFTELEATLDKLPTTVTQITPGKRVDGEHTGTGEHLIFKTGGQSFACRNGVAKNIDIKANGGYIVVAPSVHPHGTGSYKFAEGLTFNDIELAELSESWIGWLQSKEQTKKKAALEPTLLPASEAIIEACRQEVVKCKTAVEGQSGDKQTYEVALIIFYDWGLAEIEGKPILDEFNMRCVPEWDDKKLQHKIDCAIAHTGDKPRGWKRFAHPIEGGYHQLFGAFVLNPARTLPSALAFRRDKYSHPEGFTLRYYASDFYCWSENHYHRMDKDSIGGMVLNWLTRSAVSIVKDKSRWFPANSKNTNDVVEALKSACLLPVEVKSGAWLGDGEMSTTTPPIFAQNCVYDWKTGDKYAHTPLWFNQSCLNTAIIDDAPTPIRWNWFLNELWGDEQASKDLLHEFMGLCLTMDTSFQKMLLFVGPTRSGKGTIFRTTSAILGETNVATPTTESLTDRFGLHPLLGKPLATISDARFSGSKTQIAIERLLSITGEDAVTIDRKNRNVLSVKLPTRIWIGSNEMPRLPDSAGAVANRFLILRMTKSFLGYEDRTLEPALLQELPGILQLALEGLRRLHRQGFTRTAYQADYIRDMEDLGAPIRTFVREECVLGIDKRVASNRLWHTWQE